MHVQFRSRIDSRKLSPSLIGSFLTEQTFLKQMSIFFRNSNLCWKCRDQKKKISDNLVHNILELYNVLRQTRLTTSKTKRVSSIANLVHVLHHELPNELRLRILGNQEILEKSQIWVET